MTDAPIEKTRPSLDDLLALGDARVEVIDGEIKDMSPVGGLHHIIAGNVFRVLDKYVMTSQIGIVFIDGLIYLMHSESGGLKHSFVPDISFIRNENIPADWQIEKPFPGTPDLAVEVLSPDDKAEVIEAKVRAYLEKGAEEVWVVYPEEQTIYQHRRSQPDLVRSYSVPAQIDTSALFPELELTTDTIFTLPSWAKK